MCGRFVLDENPEVIQKAFDLDNIPTIESRFNIAPTQPVAVITNQDPKSLDYHKWGLIPSWSKDPKIGGKMFNARSETAHEKPSFRAAFKRRRCLIPATGFYEWTSRDGGKVPMYIHMKNGEPFAFAGLWEIWNSPEGDEIRSCTILTGEPNELIKPLHHRMAIILAPSDYEMWLTTDEVAVDEVKSVLNPYPSEAMTYYEVPKTVNSVANEGPHLIEPHNPPEQQSMF